MSISKPLRQLVATILQRCRRSCNQVKKIKFSRENPPRGRQKGKVAVCAPAPLPDAVRAKKKSSTPIASDKILRSWLLTACVLKRPSGSPDPHRGLHKRGIRGCGPLLLSLYWISSLTPCPRPISRIPDLNIRRAIPKGEVHPLLKKATDDLANTLQHTVLSMTGLTSQYGLLACFRWWVGNPASAPNTRNRWSLATAACIVPGADSLSDIWTRPIGSSTTSEVDQITKKSQIDWQEYSIWRGKCGWDLQQMGLMGAWHCLAHATFLLSLQKRTYAATWSLSSGLSKRIELWPVWLVWFVNKRFVNKITSSQMTWLSMKYLKKLDYQRLDDQTKTSKYLWLDKQAQKLNNQTNEYPQKSLILSLDFNQASIYPKRDCVAKCLEQMKKLWKKELEFQF